MKPNSAKNKGRRLQQWVCRRISELTGYKWGRSGEDKPIESRPMGQSGPDIRLESHVQKIFPYSVECKYQEGWSIPAWIQQAQQNQAPETDWLLIIRKNDYKPIVIMDAEAFFRLQHTAADNTGGGIG